MNCNYLQQRHSQRVVLIHDRPELRAAIESLEAPEEMTACDGRDEVGRLVKSAYLTAHPRATATRSNGST